MAEFDFSGKDSFDLLETLIKLLTEFKNSQDTTATTATADVAKFLIRWTDHLATLSKKEREQGVQRVLNQMALDKESFKEDLKENLKYNQELVKRDMRFYLILFGVITILSSVLGPEALTLLKYLISYIPK